jgi:hypothetical protein
MRGLLNSNSTKEGNKEAGKKLDAERLDEIAAKLLK